MTNTEIIDGIKYWYNSDRLLHREDGPAVEFSDGSKQWFINGYYHREDGPAIEWNSGSMRWYIKGIEISDEVWQWIKDNNFPDYKEWTDSIKVLFKLKFG